VRDEYIIVRQLNKQGHTILKLLIDGKYVKFVTKDDAVILMNKFNAKIVEGV